MPSQTRRQRPSFHGRTTQWHWFVTLYAHLFSHHFQVKKIAGIKYEEIMAEYETKKSAVAADPFSFVPANTFKSLFVFTSCFWAHRAYLKEEIAPLWPKFWMTATELFSKCAFRFPPVPSKCSLVLWFGTHLFEEQRRKPSNPRSM